MTARVSASRQLLKGLESLTVVELYTMVRRLRLAVLPLCMLIYSIDLNNRNVMWGICSLDSYDRHTTYKYLGRPQK